MSLKLFFIILVYFLRISISIKNKQYARFYRVDICKEAKDNPFKWDYITVDNSHSSYSSINAKCYISRDVKSVRMATEVIRCANKDSADTCEPYATIKPLDTCGIIALKGMAWTNYIHSFEPPLICPFKKGVYVQTNGTLDPNIFRFFPLHGFYWKGIFNIFEENKYIFSLCTESSVVKINE